MHQFKTITEKEIIEEAIHSLHYHLSSYKMYLNLHKDNLYYKSRIEKVNQQIEELEKYLRKDN